MTEPTATIGDMTDDQRRRLADELTRLDAEREANMTDDQRAAENQWALEDIIRLVGQLCGELQASEDLRSGKPLRTPDEIKESIARWRKWLADHDAELKQRRAPIPPLLAYIAKGLI